MGCIMNRCQTCNVLIMDDVEICPLCHCVVEADEAGTVSDRYPDVRLIGRKIELISRIILFLSIVVGACCVILDMRDRSGPWWSAAVVGALAYIQLIVFFMIENDHAGYRSKIIIGTACGIAYLIMVDYVFGFTRWSLNFAVPGALLATDLMIIVLMFVNMRSWQSYLLFQIFMTLCSGVCVLLYFAGVITVPAMSYIAFGCSLMMFLATFIIGGKRAGNELKRRFHV